MPDLGRGLLFGPQSEPPEQPPDIPDELVDYYDSLEPEREPADWGSPGHPSNAAAVREAKRLSREALDQMGKRGPAWVPWQDIEAAAALVGLPPDEFRDVLREVNNGWHGDLDG